MVLIEQTLNKALVQSAELAVRACGADSAEVVFDVGDLGILPCTIRSNDLQHQIPHVWRQRLLTGLRCHLGQTTRGNLVTPHTGDMSHAGYVIVTWQVTFYMHMSLACHMHVAHVIIT